jgi:hypothetical protein
LNLFLTYVIPQLAAVDSHATYRYVDGTFWNAPEAGYTVADLWDKQ